MRELVSALKVVANRFHRQQVLLALLEVVLLRLEHGRYPLPVRGHRPARRCRRREQLEVDRLLLLEAVYRWLLVLVDILVLVDLLVVLEVDH